jgi:hypothetical protein
MRNYVLMYFGAVTYTTPGGPPPEAKAIVVGETPQDLEAGLADKAANLSGLGFTILGTAATDKRYFLLNKSNVTQLVNSISPDFWITATGFQQGTACAVEGTPRSHGTFPSSDGKRKPDTSPSSVFAAFYTNDFGIPAALVTLAKALRRQHLLRPAALVQYAIDRINDLSWTIFEAVAYLRRNGILP